MTTFVRRAALLILMVLAVAVSIGGPSARQEQKDRPQPAAGQTATRLPDGRWLLVGGDANPLNAAIWDPGARAARPIVGSSVSRSWHTATLLPDGTVLIVGGVDAAGQIVGTPERFDPATGAFAPIDDVDFTPRARHTATVLPDGRVLIAGGETAPGAVAAEVWEPGASTADPVSGGTRFARRGHTARLMPDGRVVLVGGEDGAGRRVAGDEVFDPSAGFQSLAPSTMRGEGAAALVGSRPEDGSTEVPTDTRIALRFGEALDVASVGGTTVTLEGPEGLLGARLVVSEEALLVFVTPSRTLNPDTTYALKIAGLRAGSGHRVASAVVRFTTRAKEPDAVPLPPLEPEIWAPGMSDTAWRDSPWRKLPPLQAPKGVTALAGQALLLNGRPLADVTLTIGKAEARTDRTGRFLLKLASAPSGFQPMLIDGTTANRGRETYGLFEVAVQLVGRQTAALPYTIWMPRIDTANAMRIPSPTREETVITTPRIPGLELHLPPHTVVTDHDGKAVREISITPIPVDRPPFPLPTGVQVPIYFTIQPGGAYIAVQSYGKGRRGAQLFYPNYRNRPVGTEHFFWQYDPEEKGWHVYGMGQVAAPGRQVVPNPGVELYEFTGAMINDGQSPAPDRGNGPPVSDPVDSWTGEFVMEKTDLVVRDVNSLMLTRTYRSADNGQRPFGIGATHPYAMFLWSANEFTEADLILPEGKRIHYVRTSGGTGYADAVFEHTSSPTAYHSSKIVWNGHGWDLTLKDGTVYVFGDEAPLQSIRDRFGNTVTLTWSATNAHGSGIGKILKVTSPNGRYLEFTYDTSNRITQAKDTLGRTVGYQYDASGRVWKVTDAKGGVTEYTYDIAHRLLTIKDPRNIVYLTNEYDTNGRVDRQTQADSGVFDFAYTLNGSQVTQTDVTNPRGYVRRLTFNTDRFLTSDVEAVGQTVQQTTSYTRLTGSNLLESVTDSLGRVTRYQYDTKGNVTSVTHLYGTSDAKTTTFTYEPTYNLLASVTNPLTHTTSFAYDSQGRPTSVTDALGHQTTFTLDGGGQVVGATNALGQTTTFGHDLGDLVRVTTPLGHTQTQLVDVAGRVLRVTDAKGATTKLEYDNLNQVTKTIDPLTGETTFTYDGNGNLLTLTDARGKTTTWTYNNMDRVATRTDPLTRQESFSYDLNGNLTSWTDRKNQVTTYTYDPLDRKTFVGFGTTGIPPSYQSTISYTYDAGNRPNQIVDSVAGTITRGYDLLDRLTSETTSEGSISYTYDGANRRATMTVAGQTAVSYGYDNASRLTGITQGTANVTIAYDNADRRTSLTLPNGIVMEYGYDTDSRLTGITYKLGSQTLGMLTYSYDANGQRTALGGTWARTNLPTALTSATYDNANQIATFGGTTFTYDSNGNLTSDGTRAYTWNARNQLATLTGPVNATFAHDGLARRRSKTIVSATTQFLYDGLNPVQELAGGSPTANLLTGGLDQFFTRTDSNGARHYLTDALGSSVALSDGSGTTQTEYSYEPFGGFTTSGAVTGNPFAFTGREADGTGLLYYRARYYDARLQRFLSEDPAGFSDGANMHVYVGCQPTGYTDPLGLRRKDGGQYSFPGVTALFGRRPERDCGAVPVAPRGTDMNANIRLTRERADYFGRLRALTPWADPDFLALWLVFQVAPGGPWDYKRHGRDFIPFGNFHFGVVGSAAGYDEETLLRGAGWAQIWARNWSPSFGVPWGAPPYGDGPDDQVWIRRGIEYYRCITERPPG